MADKQSGTGARGRGHKSAEGRGTEQTKNPVSAKNNSKQKKDMNRSNQNNDSPRGSRGQD